MPDRFKNIPQYLVNGLMLEDRIMRERVGETFVVRLDIGMYRMLRKEFRNGRNHMNPYDPTETTIQIVRVSGDPTNKKTDKRLSFRKTNAPYAKEQVDVMMRNAADFNEYPRKLNLAQVEQLLGHIFGSDFENWHKTYEPYF